MSKDSTQGNSRKDYSNDSTFALIPITGGIPKLKCGLLKVYSSLIAHSFIAGGKRITKATNNDIGQHIGANPRSITRSISVLVKSGLLQVETTGIVRTIELISEFSAAGSVHLAFDDPAWSFSNLEFKVYFALRRFKGRNHLAFPTNQTIAKFLGIGLSQVKTGLQGLNSKGVTDPVKLWNGWNKWSRRIHFPELPMAETNPRQNPAIEVLQKTNPRQNPAIEVLQAIPTTKPGLNPRQNPAIPTTKPGLNPRQNPAIEDESLRVNIKKTNKQTHTVSKGQSGGVCVGDFSISSEEPKPKPEIDQAQIEDTISRFKGLYKAYRLNKQNMIDVIRVLKPKLEKELIPLEFLENCLDEINKETLYPVKVFIRNLDRWDTYDESEKATFSDKSAWESSIQDIDKKKPLESGFNGAGRDSKEVIAERDGYVPIWGDFEKKLNHLPKDFIETIYKKKFAQTVNGKVWVKVKECEWFIDRYAKGLQLPDEENFEPSGPVDHAGQIANKLEAVKAKTLDIKAKILATNKKIEIEATKAVETGLQTERNRIGTECHGDMKQLEKALDLLRSMEETRMKEAIKATKEKYRHQIETLEEEANKMNLEWARLENELRDQATAATPKPKSFYTDKKEISSGVLT